MKTTFNVSKLFTTEFAVEVITIGAGILIAHRMGYKYGCKVTRAKDLKLFYHFNPEVAKDFMVHCSEMYVKHAK